MDSSFNVCVSVILSVPCSLVVTCQERTDLLVTLFSCFFYLPTWYPGSGLVCDFIDSWLLPTSF